MRELVLNVLDLVLKSYRNLYEAANQKQTSSDEDHENNKKPKTIITQNQALQILFDLKFLFTLFDIKSFGIGSPSSSFYVDQSQEELTREMTSKLNEAFKTTTGLYESLVDPFDYDICMPFIQSNVVKCIARSSVSSFYLLGFIFH